MKNDKKPIANPYVVLREEFDDWAVLFKRILSTISRATFSTFFSLFLSSCLLLALLLVSPGETYGDQVTLGWNPSTSPNLAGYTVCWGTASNTYSFNADAGNQTTYTVTGLAEGVTYYFAAKAYDTAGIQSAPSNEVSYTVPGKTNINYVGCFTDDTNRALPAELSSGGETVESCTQKAAAAGYAYAGLQYYGQCFAGNKPGYTRVADSECNMPCTANPAEMCGGVWYNSIYRASVTPYVGCFTDDTNRALPAELSSGGETVESCMQKAAAAGYAYAGLQYYGQCFAGNTPGYTRVADSGCNIPCTANPAEMCGGVWYNSIYRASVTP